MPTQYIIRAFGGTLKRNRSLLLSLASSLAPSTLGLVTSGPVIPCAVLTPFYTVNGTILDSQPFVFTAPQAQNRMIVAGSTFVLLFNSPSSATRSMLANGSIVTMLFRLFNDKAVSGQVSIASTLTGTVFQVNVIVLQTITL